MHYTKEPDYIRNHFGTEEIGEDLRIKLPQGMTAGIEIESTGQLREMHFSLLDPDEQIDILLGWKSKNEVTVKDGIEIVSPQLRGTEQESKDLYAICNMLTQLDQTVSEECGAHVHIGANYLTSKKSYVNLITIWANAERILYKISNPPGELPRPESVSNYAKPISGKIEEAIKKGTIDLESEEDLQEFTTKLKDVQGSRHLGLNFLNVTNLEKTTIEFRLSNGTLNPKTWIENINLYAGIVNVSEELTYLQKKPEQDRTEAEKEKITLFERIGREKLDERQMLDILLTLSVSPEKRGVYRERYEANSELLESDSKIRTALEKRLASKPITTKRIRNIAYSGPEAASGEEILAAEARKGEDINLLLDGDRFDLVQV